MFKFLENLTRRNWGFPYHLFLALVATQLISKLTGDQLSGFLIVNVSGFLYEVWQNRSGGGGTFQNSLEDIAGNLAGSGAGVGLLAFNFTL